MLQPFVYSNSSFTVDDLNNGEEDDALERDMNGPHHHLHNDSEPVLGRGSYDLPPPDGADSQRRVRKVAAGPTVASYKGTSNRFSYEWNKICTNKMRTWKLKVHDK